MNIPEFFSLNLGAYSIKIAESRKKGNNVVITNLKSFPTSITKEDINNPTETKKVAGILQKVIKEAGVKSKNCVISLPESQIFSRTITIPKVNEQEIEQAIGWALRPLLPYPIETVNISYLEIDEKNVEGSLFIEWYVAAAKKDLIDYFKDLLSSIGINLIAVDTEALSLARVAYFNYPENKNKPYLILDLGGDNTNIVLAKNGVVMFSQVLETGSNTINKVISNEFGIDQLQAEKYKARFGLLETPDNKVYSAIQPIGDIIVGEVVRTIEYYREKLAVGEINKIYITGGGSNMPGFDVFIKKKLNLDVEHLNLTKILLLDKVISDKLVNLSLSSYNVSVGLSIKGVTEN